MGSGEIYLAHRELIDRAIGSVCRRHRLSGADAEDFAGGVRLHLIEDDYGVLRRFQGRSSLQTYLVVVITHYFQDFRNARWGKWRPSAEARRLGPLGVQLETLVVRDGLSLDEAYETLRTHEHVAESRQAIEAIAARFPSRPRRTFVPDDALEERPAADAGPDATVQQAQAAEAARRVAAALSAAVAGLAPQDRLILRMRFEDDCGVADIARALQIDQKPLYRRIERLLSQLRSALEAGGLSAEQAAGVLEARGFDLLAESTDETAKTRGDVRPFNRGARSSVQNAGAE